MKDPATMARAAGFKVGALVHRKGNSDGGQPYMIIALSPTETELQECTFDREPSNVTEVTKDLSKEWTIHKTTMQVKMPAPYDCIIKSADWELECFQRAVHLAMRSVVQSTSFDPQSIDLFKNPYAARAALDKNKGELELVAATTNLTSKKAPATALGIARFTPMAGATGDGH